MNSLMETLVVVLVSVAGVYIGRRLSISAGLYKAFGLIIPFLLIGLILAGRFLDSFIYYEPLASITIGHFRFVVLAFAISLGLTTPMTQLKYKWEKVIVVVVMVIFVICFSVMPCFVPVMFEREFSSLQTSINADGVCIQSRNYTCGPAAAVTALTKLGLDADEGQLAILSRTSPVTGTLPQDLYGAINDLYAKQGLECQFRKFDSVKELINGGVTLVIMQETFMIDHCVAVLDVSNDVVTIGDPEIGKISLPLSKFESTWKFAGIVLKRNQQI
jgi:predicted double-glycine peptidase